MNVSGKKGNIYLTSLSFLFPILILFISFVIYPIVQSIIISFYKWDGIGKKVWVGLQNYAALFTDETFFISIKNNVIWLVSMLFAPVIALLLSLLLNQKVRGIRIIKSLFFFPFVVNLVVVGLIFSWFYNPDFGLLAKMLKFIGIPPIPILADERYATLGIIFAAFWPQIAYCMIIYLTGLTNIDANIVEAGRVDGASSVTMLWNIILPQLRPATFICVVITIIGALRNFDLIAIMTTGGPYGTSNVLAYFMYEEFHFQL